MIYFIQARDGGPIKIGTTIRLATRLKELAKDSGVELRVLAVVEGNRDVEQSFHARFSHLRAVGEWFEPGDDLIGFIVAEGREWDGSDEALAPRPERLHMDVIESARIVSAYRGESMVDMLSDILRPVLAKMEQEEVVKRTRSTMPKKPKGT